MHSSLSARLAQLELRGLSIRTDIVARPETLPDEDSIDQVLRAVWSDLFTLFPDTALEEDAEEIAWGFVNLFHRAAAKRMARLDRATDEIRCLIASADGSEVHSSELETQVARARAAETAMIGLEQLREAAALLYLQETGSSWRPAGGSRLNQSASAVSAVVDARDYLRARAENRRKAAAPEGTPVLFAGGRLSFAALEDAKAFASNVWSTLDRVRENVADMVLVHGGDRKGSDRLAASWAERRKVPQLVFGLDPRLGKSAGFRRNERMLALKPRYLVAFPGNGVLERLVIQAKERRIAVVDRRGPLGTNPKPAAAHVTLADGRRRADVHIRNPSKMDEIV